MTGRAAALGLLLCLTLLESAWTQTPPTPTDAAAASTEPRTEGHAPADIPARADADEQFIQALLRRSKLANAAPRFEASLARQTQAVKGLNAQSNADDLALLSVPRLESLQRHWALYDRELTRTRADLARSVNVISEDVAGLAERRAVWRATRLAAADSAPALLQRADEVAGQIERAEAELAAQLAKMFELGRKATALSTQVRSAMAAVQARIADHDRRLLLLDMPPLWKAVADPAPPDSLDTGLRKSLEIESAFARDYDAAYARLHPMLLALAVLLLPLMFWLKRRARERVAVEPATAVTLQALSRPWAAWLVLVAIGAVLYDLQGPIIRQQIVMLLAWVPVLALVQRRVLIVLGPWAWLSAGFYSLNVMGSLLTGNPLLYRCLLLALNGVMLVTLIWLLLRARRIASEAAPNTASATQTLAVHAVLAVAGVALLASAASNLLGNVSLSAMLTTAVLDSSYLALGLYAGAIVVVALVQVLLSRPRVSRLSARHAGSLVPVAARLAGVLLLLAWLVYTLQSLRVYRPLSDLLVAVLTYDFRLGVLSISLGNVVAFVAATWAAFWLARTVRLLLSVDVLPALSLPRGVGNSISTLSYYGILVLGLFAALAMAGFQVGQFAIVFGALGLGIGLGLQDVVKNFVAGLILMFERPIQPGDVVDVAAMSGTVREIGMRATTITTFEGADVIVPNGMLLADKLVNWTLNGSSRRINVNVSTGYGVSPQQTIELLVAIARGLDGIAMSPEPAAILTGLAPGALEFNVRAWTTQRADWVMVRSELAMRIRDGLVQAGIEVPLPQREMHLRRGERPAASS